jgi:hypothetical protein
VDLHDDLTQRSAPVLRRTQRFRLHNLDLSNPHPLDPTRRLVLTLLLLSMPLLKLRASICIFQFPILTFKFPFIDLSISPGFTRQSFNFRLACFNHLMMRLQIEK